VAQPSGIFDPGFVTVLRGLVSMHHSLYPDIPPRDIFFESLVERAFDKVQKPFDLIKGTPRNASMHDLLVDGKKISIKTETGKSTNAKTISITKLCTTEKDPWESAALVERVLAHLSRYDTIVMLRAVWRTEHIHYQLVEIPIDDLRLISTGMFIPVGKRKTRKSLGSDIVLDGQVIFHVHFDGSDGKCQVRGGCLSVLGDCWKRMERS